VEREIAFQIGNGGLAGQEGLNSERHFSPYGGVFEKEVLL
jgi:hypothetical protein